MFRLLFDHWLVALKELLNDKHRSTNIVVDDKPVLFTADAAGLHPKCRSTSEVNLVKNIGLRNL